MGEPKSIGNLHDKEGDANDETNSLSRAAMRKAWESILNFLYVSTT